MFYTKAKLNEEVTVTVELNDENVFCTCPDCGDEVCVWTCQKYSPMVSVICTVRRYFVRTVQ